MREGAVRLEGWGTGGSKPKSQMECPHNGPKATVGRCSVSHQGQHQFPQPSRVPEASALRAVRDHQHLRVGDANPYSVVSPAAVSAWGIRRLCG